MALEVSIADADHVPGSFAGGHVVYPNAYRGGDVIHAVSARGTEDFVVQLEEDQSNALEYDVSLRGVAGLRLVEGSLEFLDADGAPRLRMARGYVADSRGRTRRMAVTVSGCAVDTSARLPWGRAVTPPGAGQCRIRLEWDADGLQAPLLIDPAWTMTDSMAEPRFDHAAVRFGGFVLVVGGANNIDPELTTAEVFDQASGTWASTGSTQFPRRDHTLSLPADGFPVVIGGSLPLAAQRAERFLPGTGTWVEVGDPIAPHVSHSATVLNDGRVLVAGGPNSSVAEIYDPATESFALTATSMNEARMLHAATLLTDGRVLVAGGQLPGFPADVHDTAEIYDPNADSWSATGNLRQNRRAFTMTPLNDGRVMAVGGGLTEDPSAEVFDAATGMWVYTESAALPRGDHTAILLPSTGRVLVAGGFYNTPLSSSELFVFDGVGDAWCSAGTMLDARGVHTATALASSPAVDPPVLVAGGFSPIVGATATAEIYDPTQCSDACDDGSACTSDDCDVVTGCCTATNVDVCGNGICGPDEAACNCPQDCGIDSDGDGLSDDWETTGVDTDCDGIADLDLQALGTNPQRQDVFVEVDFFVNGIPGDGHNHHLSLFAEIPLKAAFANAPVANPDGSTGITLHIDQSEAMFEAQVVTTDVFVGGVPGPDAVTLDDIHKLHFDPDRSKVFRYALMAHHVGYPNNAFGAIARPPDKMVLGIGTNSPDQVTPEGQAFLFMHELGHLFGLQHGGDSAQENYEVNYLSVMNYRFISGIPTLAGENVLDYSRQELADIDEQNLDEPAGLGNGMLATTHRCRLENNANCPSDCQACACGNGTCQPIECGENNDNCPQDCLPCDPSGNACNGDGACQAIACVEGSAPNCADCPSCADAMCGDGNCDNHCLFVPATVLASANLGDPIDWNCDGDAGDVGLAYNVDDTFTVEGLNQNPTLTVHTGYDDWGNLNASLLCDAGGGGPGFYDIDHAELRELGTLFPWLYPQLDILPQCDENPIALEDPGEIEVVLFGDEDFDVSAVDLETLLFANTVPLTVFFEDVDEDGRLDLVALFAMDRLVASPSSTELALHGRLASSQPFHASDGVTIVPELTDGDGDGVVDGCDACPNTPPGVVVGADGCPLGAGPVARCRDVVIAADASCEASASVDDGSFDPEGGDVVLSQEPPGPYALGTTLVTLTVDDGMASATCEALVTVVDETPPSIEVSVTPEVLWPPNHKLVSVDVMAVVEDGCDAEASASLVSVTSSEPDDATGDGSSTGDVQWSDLHDVRLRAERAMPGPGRVYTLELVAEDASGNVSSTTTEVRVPAAR